MTYIETDYPARIESLEKELATWKEIAAGRKFALRELRAESDIMEMELQKIADILANLGFIDDTG